uniref:Uncharacterized protein n=1 Tax=Anopheles albimanus TaxID=7167 RepID=A0A182FZ28_ANOAL
QLIFPFQCLYVCVCVRPARARVGLGWRPHVAPPRGAVLGSGGIENHRTTTGTVTIYLRFRTALGTVTNIK